MTQKPISPSRQSDFPIFDYLAALNPARWWSEFTSIPRYQRMLIISIFASAVLAVTVIGLVKMGVNHYMDTRGAFLFDALTSPYAIEGRTVPQLNGFAALPASAGDYNFTAPLTDEEQAAADRAEADTFRTLTTTVADALRAYVIVPPAPIEGATEDPALAEQIATQQQAVITAADHIADFITAAEGKRSVDSIFDLTEMGPVRQSIIQLQGMEIALPEVTELTNRMVEIDARRSLPFTLIDCLAGTAYLDTEAALTCGTTTVAAHIETGSYVAPDGRTVKLVAARFEDQAVATATMKDLYRYGRLNGRVGNFTIGVMPVDYFYNRLHDESTFAWAHEGWVFVAAADSFGTVDHFMAAFPY